MREKADLRNKARALRTRLSQDLPDAGTTAATHFLRHFVAQSEHGVAAYWPLKGEIATQPLLSLLVKKGVPIALPRIVAADQALAFHSWSPGMALVKNRFGVEEPPVGCPPFRPSLVLVPLLAFDRWGNRLGFGGGFYDRTLKTLRSDGKGSVLTVGFAYGGQQVSRVPTGPYDEKLDYIVTESGCMTAEAFE